MSFNDYWQAHLRRRAVASAIAALRPDDGTAQDRFLLALSHAALLLPAARLPDGYESGELVTEEGVQLHVPLAEGADGTQFLMVFTGEDALWREYPEHQPYVAVPFPMIARLAMEGEAKGVIIDRSGPIAATLGVPLLGSFLAAVAAQQSSERARRAVRQPISQLKAGPPTRVINHREIAALGRCFERHPELAQAFLFGMIQDDGRRMLTVALGFPDGPEPATLSRLAAEVREILGRAGVIVMDAQLATILSRQPGAIRWDLAAGKGGDSEAAAPPIDPPPPPA